MFRKTKEVTQETPPKIDDQQLLTRSRVREVTKNNKRNSWLNKAIIIVAILLAITIYAVFKL